MKPRQDRSDIKVIRLPKKQPRQLGSITGEGPKRNSITAQTMAELAVEGKVTAQQVINAIKSGGIKAKTFKTVFWKRMSRDFFTKTHRRMIRQLAPVLL
jgi:hypothetical protein